MHCGQDLSVAQSQAGTGGGCPRCGQWIVSPEHAQAPVVSLPAARLKIPAKGEHRVRPQFKAGHLMPDSAVDRVYQNRREMGRIFRIVGSFILAFCLCVAAYWFLQKKING